MRKQPITNTIADLIPDPQNARKHPERNIRSIVKSLEEVGAGRSIVIDENNVILAGNGLVEGAGIAGIENLKIVDADGETIVAVRRTGLSDVQKKRLALLDNRTAELAEWDADVLAEMVSQEFDFTEIFNQSELDTIIAGITSTSGVLPGVDPDEVPEPETVETRCKPGDLWQLGRHRLLCGDCTVATDVERLMGEQTCEMVWTDPPYGVAIGDKNKYLNTIGRSNRVEENLTNDKQSEEGLLTMLRDCFSLAVSVCTPGAAWYVAAPAGPLYLLFGMALKELKIWHQVILWVKNNATFSPIGVDYHWQHEPIFYGWVPNAAHRYRGGRKQTTVWEIDRPMASPEHPTMKPVELVRRAVENSSDIGQIVYDPFLGSGTTIIASEETGRICYGMEIEPKYCDVILTRWENATGKTAELIELTNA